MRSFYSRWKIQIILSLSILIIFLIPLIQGKVLYWGTVSLQFIPWSSFAIDSLLSGDFPLWNSFNGMGAPLVANYQSGIFYPINWLLIPFYKFLYIQGLAFGFSILLICHLIIAAIGFSCILKFLNRSGLAQLLGSFCWVFGGYIIARVSFISMVWSFAWVSWILFFVLRLKNSQKAEEPRIAFWLAILFLVQLLCGHAQTFAFTVGLSLVLLILPYDSAKKIKVKNFLYFSLSLLISLGLASIQLVPTMEYLFFSQRSSQVGYEYATNFSFWPLRIFSLLFPNFWGNPGMDRFFGGGTFWEDQIYHGVFGFIFVLLSILFVVQANKRKTFSEKKFVLSLLLLIIIVFFIALGKNFYFYPLLYKYIPGISLFQGPSRFLILFSFAFCILISYGFDYWNGKNFNVRKIGLLTVASLAILCASFAVFSIMKSIPKNIFTSIWYTSSLLFGFSVLSIKKSKYPNRFFKIIPTLVVIIFMIDLAIVNYPYGHYISKDYFLKNKTTFVNDSESSIYLEENTETFLKFNKYFRFDRFQLLGETLEQFSEFIPNTNLVSPRYQMVNNFDPFVPNRFAQFVSWLQKLSVENQQKILGYFGVNEFISLDINSESGIKRKTIDAEPKVVWTSCAIQSKPANILNQIFDSIEQSINDQCVFLEEDLNSERLDTKTIENTGNLDYISFTNGKIEIKYKSNNPGWIVIRQVWYPGWKAKIDETIALKIHQVDYLFQGVYVPEGNHSILITYKPDSFLYGCLISSISLVILLIFIFRNSNKVKK